MDITTQHTLYNIVKTIHGLTGLTIFLTGVLQFVLKKGGKVHRRIGRVYNYAWIVIIATGAYIGSAVVVAIVLMGFYLSVTGVRMAIRKGKPYGTPDKIILAVALLIVLFMIYAAIEYMIRGMYGIAIISAFFALLYSFVMVLDVSHYMFNKKLIGRKKDYGKSDWYIEHLSRMQFSFITAVGAFTAVQNLLGNMVLNFIVPAVIGFFAVRMSRRYFIKKLKLA